MCTRSLCPCLLFCGVCLCVAHAINHLSGPKKKKHFASCLSPLRPTSTTDVVMWSCAGRQTRKKIKTRRPTGQGTVSRCNDMTINKSPTFPSLSVCDGSKPTLNCCIWWEDTKNLKRRQKSIVVTLVERKTWLADKRTVPVRVNESSCFVCLIVGNGNEKSNEESECASTSWR